MQLEFIGEDIHRDDFVKDLEEILSYAGFNIEHRNEKCISFEATDSCGYLQGVWLDEIGMEDLGDKPHESKIATKYCSQTQDENKLKENDERQTDDENYFIPSFNILKFLNENLTHPLALKVTPDGDYLRNKDDKEFYGNCIFIFRSGNYDFFTNNEFVDKQLAQII